MDARTWVIALAAECAGVGAAAAFVVAVATDVVDLGAATTSWCIGAALGAVSLRLFFAKVPITDEQ